MEKHDSRFRATVSSATPSGTCGWKTHGGRTDTRCRLLPTRRGSCPVGRSQPLIQFIEICSHMHAYSSTDARERSQPDSREEKTRGIMDAVVVCSAHNGGVKRAVTLETRSGRGIRAGIIAGQTHTPRRIHRNIRLATAPTRGTPTFADRPSLVPKAGLEERSSHVVTAMAGTSGDNLGHNGPPSPGMARRVNDSYKIYIYRCCNAKRVYETLFLPLWLKVQTYPTPSFCVDLLRQCLTKNVTYSSLFKTRKINGERFKTEITVYYLNQSRQE